MGEPRRGPTLEELFALFAAAQDVPQYEIIPAGEVPPPYHGLLVHEHHMTVTVEEYHGDLVDVRILDRRHQGDDYARKILLTLQKSGKVVQFGIMHVDLSFCTPQVRAEIVAGQTPFGRILIKHNVMRRIEPTAYLRLLPGPAMMGWFGMSEARPVYGRLAYIHCNGRPAVQLLEVVAP
jgi:hypothetical protein